MTITFKGATYTVWDEEELNRLIFVLKLTNVIKAAA